MKLRKDEGEIFFILPKRLFWDLKLHVRRKHGRGKAESSVVTRFARRRWRILRHDIYLQRPSYRRDEALSIKFLLFFSMEPIPYVMKRMFDILYMKIV